MEKNIVKLGKEKEVEILPWKTKTKKEFLKTVKEFAENGKEMKEDDILRVLLYPYVNTKNIYLSDDEKQYLLVKIRDISLPQDIEYTINCSNCDGIIDVRCKPLEMVNYQENQYPVIKNDILWEDLQGDTKPLIQSIIRKYGDYLPQTIEMLLHIKKYKDEEITDFEKMIEIYEDLSLMESETIVDTYDEVKSKMLIEKDIKCDLCEFEDTYYFDTIPDLFEPLLPKEAQ